MFICGETGVQLKAELIGETTYFKLYNVFGSDGRFIYRTTEYKQLKSHKDNVAIIFGYDVPLTAEEKKTECVFTRRCKKLDKNENR